MTHPRNPWVFDWNKPCIILPIYHFCPGGQMITTQKTTTSFSILFMILIAFAAKGEARAAATAGQINFQLAGPVQFTAASPGLTINQSLQVIKTGTLPVTLTSKTALLFPFSYLGGTYPGKGGTCSNSISKNCTLVVSFIAPSQQSFSTTLSLNYSASRRVYRSAQLTLQGGVSAGPVIPPVQPPVINSMSAAASLLVVYNAASSDSKNLKDFYLSQRPGISDANVLAVNVPNPGEFISDVNYTNLIETPVKNWFNANPSKNIHSIVLMYGLPSRRVDPANISWPCVPSNYSVAYSLSTAITKPGSEYSYFGVNGNFQGFDRSKFEGTTALVTWMDMGSYDATVAYIQKLKGMYSSMSKPDNVISASNAGKGGSTYFLDEMGKPANYEAVVDETYLNLLNIISPAAAVFQNQAHISLATNPAGMMTWGTNGGLPVDYATNGKSLVINGTSTNWYLLLTVESYNGQRNNGSQSSFVQWYKSNAFGGAGYSNTPVGSVGHTEEPYLDGVSKGSYFVAWEKGLLSSEAAWASRNTNCFMPVGDPWVKK